MSVATSTNSRELSDVRQRGLNRLIEHKAQFYADIEETLRQNIFDNIGPLSSMRQLSRTSQQIADAYLQTLAGDLPPAAMSQHMLELVQRGLGVHAAFLTAERILQTSLEILAAEPLLTRVLKSSIEAYHKDFILNYQKAYSANIKTEQELMQRGLQSALEKQIASERQLRFELERQQTQLQAATEIARVTTSILDLNELLHTAVFLLRKRFDLHYVGAFLLDDYRQFAILRIGIGHTETIQLPEGYKLPLNEQNALGWSVQNRHARLTPDVSKDFLCISAPALAATRSELVLPFVARGDTIGALLMHSDALDAFDDQKIAILRIIADQLASSISNTQLFNQTQATLAELQFTQRRQQQETWADLLTARPTYLYDQQQDSFKENFEKHPVELLTIPTSQSLKLTAHDANGHQAALAVPITVRGEVVGTIDLVDVSKPNPWGDDEVALAQAVASQAALALENAQLYADAQKELAERTRAEQELVRRAEEVVIINDMARLLAQQLDPDLQFEVAYDHLKRLMALEGFYVALYNDQNQTLAYSFIYDQGRRYSDKTERQPQGYARKVIESGQPMLWRKTSEQVAVSLGQTAALGSGRVCATAIYVPLFLGQHIMGVMSAQSYRPDVYTEHDVAVLTTAANHVTLALENARLFSQIQMALSETGRLYNASRQLGEAQDLQAMVAAVTEGLNLPIINRAVLMTFSYDAANQVSEAAVIANWHSGIGPAPTPVGRVYSSAVFDVLYLLLSPEPQFFEDLLADPNLNPDSRAIFIQQQIRALAVLPLWVSGRQIGALALEGEEPYHFTLEDMRAYPPLASQMAIAVENRRLFEQTQKALATTETQAHHLAQLNDLADQLNRLTNADDILHIAIVQAQQILGAPRVSISLLNKEGDAFERIELNPQNSALEHRSLVPLKDTGVEHALKGGQPLLIADAQATDISSLKQRATSSGDRSLILVPLQVGAHGQGTLNVTSPQANAFTTTEANLATQIASLVSASLENARLLAETQANAKELSAINEMSRAIAEQLELEPLLDTIYQQLQHIIQLDTFFISLYDERTNLLYSPFIYDLGQRYRDQPAPPSVRSNPQRVIESGEPLLILRTPAEVQEVKLTTETAIGSARPSASIMYVPLRTGQRIAGVMSVQSYQINAYTARDVVLLGNIANYVAVAIEKANLFRQTQEALNETETLYNISSQLNATDSLEAILRVAAQSDIEAGASGVSLLIFELDSSGYPAWAELAAQWSAQSSTTIPVGTRFFLPEFPFSQLWLSSPDQPLVIDQASTDTRVDAVTRQLLEVGQVEALVLIPLRVGERWVGLLTISWLNAHHATPQEERLYRAIGTQAALALSNRLLFTDMETQVKQRTTELSQTNTQLTERNQFMSALQDTSLALMNRLELGDVLQSVVERAAQLANTPHGYLFRLNPNGQVMEMEVGVGFFKERVGDRIMPGQSVAGVVWRTKEPLTVNDYPRWSNRVPHPTFDRLRSLMGVPLFSEGEVIGVLGLGQLVTDSDAPSFSDDAVINLTRFAQMAAIAIDNAQLFDTAQRELVVRRRTEEQLAIARDQALEASRLKSEFLANMSHEIRTPMNGVIGMTELLANTRLDNRQRYFVETIRSSGESLVAIINDILDLSKMEAGKLTLDQIDFSPLKVIEEAAELLAPKAHEKQLALATYIAPRVPSRVCGDPLRFRQILINLIGNAIKFTEKGEVVVTLDLDGENFEQIKLRCAVHDTGIGITPQAISKLFQPFTQADGATTRKYGGTGLGLSICNHLVQLMHGTIAVESEFGKGSTFWFTTQFERSPQADNQSTPLMSRDLVGKRLLIIENSPRQFDIIRRYAEAWDMLWDGASNQSMARELIQASVQTQRPFDIIVFSAQATQSDIFDLAITIRQIPQMIQTRLILLSNSDDEKMARYAGEAGYDLCLTKPIKQSRWLDAFSDTVLSLLEPEPISEPQPDLLRHGSLAITPPLANSGAGAGLILVAEDHPVNQEVVTLQLQQLGLSAKVVGDGRQVLESIQQQPFALILMDCQMPELDGYETTRLIRKAEANTSTHIPIIAMTAHAMQGDRELCIAAGMDDYMTKPLTVDKLLETLRHWLPNLPTQLVSIPPTKMDEPMPKAKREEPLTGPVDLKVLKELRDMAGDSMPDFLSNLIDAFTSQSEPILVGLHDFLQKSDAENVRRSAHKLKGSAANLGAKRLSTLCQELEKLGRDNNLAPAPEKLGQIEREYVEVKNVLNTQR